MCVPAEEKNLKHEKKIEIAHIMATPYMHVCGKSCRAFQASAITHLEHVCLEKELLGRRKKDKKNCIYTHER